MGIVVYVNYMYFVPFRQGSTEKMMEVRVTVCWVTTVLSYCVLLDWLWTLVFTHSAGLGNRFLYFITF